MYRHVCVCNVSLFGRIYMSGRPVTQTKCQARIYKKSVIVVCIQISEGLTYIMNVSLSHEILTACT